MAADRSCICQDLLDCTSNDATSNPHEAPCSDQQKLQASFLAHGNDVLVEKPVKVELDKEEALQVMCYPA